MVMGNRNQLQWDLPALDSFELIRAIYRLQPDDFRRTRDEFIELLDLGDLVTQARPEPVAGRADEGRDRRGAPPPPAGALPRRADDRPRRDDAEADPVFVAEYNRALRCDGPPDEPLHGRRPGALQAGRSSSTTAGSCSTVRLPTLATRFDRRRRSASRSRTRRPIDRLRAVRRGPGAEDGGSAPRRARPMRRRSPPGYCATCRSPT